MIPGNWNKIEPINEGGGKRLPAGGYEITIKRIEKDAAREFVKCYFDISAGEYAGYFSELEKRLNYWPYDGSFIRSYKPGAARFFAGFLSAVEKSNEGLTLRNADGSVDELKLEGQQVGAVLGFEEYEGNDGTVRTRLKVRAIVPVERIRTGDFSVPDVKKLQKMIEVPVADVIDTTQPVPKGFDELNEEVPF